VNTNERQVIKMKKVLVVIDMQNDFISGALGSSAAQAIVPAVVRKIKEYAQGGHIIVFTRDTHVEDYLETQEGRFLPVVHCIKNSPGWEIADEVAGAVDMSRCTVIDKGSFGSLELGQYMRENGPFEEIELVGLVSSICVVSNALIIKANLPEVKVVVDSACTAGVGEEDYLASLCVMRMCHIEVV
jgi:nicotinamidase-related amidase